MSITINREQRNAIYGEIMVELTAAGDVYAELDSGRYDAARRTRRRLEDAMRLLDDLGWEPEQDRERFELTMDAGALGRAIGTLSERAAATLELQRAEPIEARYAKRALVALAAYGEILAKLGGASSGDSTPNA